jgi:hypothetical protein
VKRDELKVTIPEWLTRLLRKRSEELGLLSPRTLVFLILSHELAPVQKKTSGKNAHR